MAARHCRDERTPTWREFGHLIAAPVRLRSSFPVASWVSLHLAVGYRFFDVGGDFHTGPALAEGGWATRDLFVEPDVQFYVAKRVAFVVGAHLSAYALGHANAFAEYELRQRPPN